LRYYRLCGKGSGGALRPVHNSINIFDSERVVHWRLGAGSNYGDLEWHANLYQVCDALYDGRAIHILFHALALSLPKRFEKALSFLALRSRDRSCNPDEISVGPDPTRSNSSAPHRYRKA